MWQWLRARPLMAISVALPAVAYVGATGAMVAQQRQFVFETNDGGRLAAAGYQAIVGGERVTLTTSDGETIAGWFVPPQPAHPVVLFLHGQGGMLVRQAERWQRMRQAGFGVLAISYRGYPGSTV